MLEAKNMSDKVFMKYLQQCLAEIYEKQVTIKHTSYSGFDVYDGNGQYLAKLAITKRIDDDYYISTRFTLSWPIRDLINDHAQFVAKLKTALLSDAFNDKSDIEAT